MRPDKPKSKSKSGSVGKVRLLMKSKLWWISGFPYSQDGKLYWRSVPVDSSQPIETLELTGPMLSRATHAAKELRREFPRALPKVVGDADAWLRSVLLLLDQANGMLFE